MEHPNTHKTSAQLEAMLFVMGEPLLKNKVKKILAIDDETLDKAIVDLKDTYNQPQRGITLIEHDDMIQLVTKKEYTDNIYSSMREEKKEDLSPALLETLAIIAYHGPVSKAGIEQIRGVQSSFSLRSLTLRGLIVQTNDSQKERDPEYTISIDFLKHLGITTIDQLPNYAQYAQEIQEQPIITKTNDNSL